MNWTFEGTVVGSVAEPAGLDAGQPEGYDGIGNWIHDECNRYPASGKPLRSVHRPWRP